MESLKIVTYPNPLMISIYADKELLDEICAKSHKLPYVSGIQPYYGPTSNGVIDPHLMVTFSQRTTDKEKDEYHRLLKGMQS